MKRIYANIKKRNNSGDSISSSCLSFLAYLNRNIFPYAEPIRLPPRYLELTLVPESTVPLHLFGSRTWIGKSQSWENPSARRWAIYKTASDRKNWLALAARKPTTANKSKTRSFVGNRNATTIIARAGDRFQCNGVSNVLLAYS